MRINSNNVLGNQAFPPVKGSPGVAAVDAALPTEVFTPASRPADPGCATTTVDLPVLPQPAPPVPDKPAVAQSNAPVLLAMDGELPALGPAGARELASWSDTLKTADSYKASILVLGFGSKGQYKDPQAAKMALDKVADQLDAEYGKGRWLAVFGGDPYKADAPDVASMVKHLQDQRSVPVLALQSDKVKEWGGVDKHLDYVHYVPTTMVPSTGPDGTVTSKIAWGGFIDGKPVGPTAAYLGEDFIGGKNPRLKGVVAVGGGEIAGQEALYARDHGIPLHYIRAEAKFEVPGGKFGAIDGMVG